MFTTLRCLLMSGMATLMQREHCHSCSLVHWPWSTYSGHYRLEQVLKPEATAQRHSKLPSQMTSQRNQNRISHVAVAKTQELQEMGGRREEGHLGDWKCRKQRGGGGGGGQLRWRQTGGKGQAAAETGDLGAGTVKGLYTPDSWFLLSSAPAAASAVGCDPSTACSEVQTAPGGMLAWLLIHLYKSGR